MQNDPARMTREERLNEIGNIMAVAIIRLKDKKSRKNNHVPLDSSPETSVYVTRSEGEKP